MLEWDTLMRASPAQIPSGTGKNCPTCPTEKGPVSHPEWDSLKPVTARDTGDLSVRVPLVPLKKKGRGKAEDEAGAAAVGPQDFRAEDGRAYELHPAAVLLLMAWAKVKALPCDETAALLLGLQTLEPGDQVRQWHSACLAVGLKPWRVLHRPAVLQGEDCTRCRHLITRLDVIGEERQAYHWACAHGYLILEHGRGTQRIWIAPPECKRFVRWYPSDWR